ncbi:MAG: hypothetical protein LBR14_04730 [Clostridiales Family XIII bacterium]|nr:hypothetical protein [Clostridiales Family XIII bacterium]
MNAQLQGVYGRLAGQIEAGCLPHALLFSGNTGRARLTLAKELAKKLFAADEVRSRKIDDEVFEDLIIVRPEKDAILVEQVEALTHAFRSKPFSADRMLAIVDKADRMNEFSQNKLLKTLEEPLGGNKIFLLAETPEKLFATIRSRCAAVRLPAGKTGADPVVRVAARNVISGALFGRATLHEVFGDIAPYCEKPKAKAKGKGAALTGADGLMPLAEESAEAPGPGAEGLLDAMEDFVRDLIVGARAPALVWEAENAAIIEKMKGRGDAVLRGYLRLLEETRSDVERGFAARSCMRRLVVRMRQEALHDSGSRR